MRVIIFTGLAVAILAYLGLMIAQPTDATPTQVTQTAPQSKYEVGPPEAQEILELVNIERAKVGVAPLQYDERLEKSAQLKSEYMAENNTKDHQLVEDKSKMLTAEMDGYVAQCSYMSENYVLTAIGTTQDGVDWWKQSPPHYAAIMDAGYSTTGIGVAYDQDQQAYYAVQHFCIVK